MPRYSTNYYPGSPGDTPFTPVNGGGPGQLDPRSVWVPKPAIRNTQPINDSNTPNNGSVESTDNPA